MLTISKPLSAGQAHAYHHEEFSNAQENYYSEGDRIRSEWQGRLAEKWELHGEVREDHFHRLSEGQHPITGEQLIRHQAAREYMNRRGDQVSPMEHRAGWDATFSAPKSVSLTALVGGDERVREAHRESVCIALDELERYVQARLGGNLPAETTSKWVAAKFEHDSARPVDGYAAPQLHTHVVFFNLTETEDGEAHALQPRELYKTQQYATAVYRSELAARLKTLGYEIERGKSGQPEIKGYSEEYLVASSQRRRQIEEHLEKENQRGADAAQIAAHKTRQSKLNLSHDEVQQRHRQIAEAFGNQPDRVVRASKETARDIDQEAPRRIVQSAMTFSKERNLEREAVVDERDLLRDAFRRSMGDATFTEVRTEFEKRVGSDEFIEVEKKSGPPGRAFTTEEMIGYERETIQMMREGQNECPALASFETRREIDNHHPHLIQSQRVAVEQILASRDQVMALEGVAGAGKTTSLAVVREAAEREGYKVEGFAPTSRAAQKLAEAGIESSTLQRQLAQGNDQTGVQKHMYVLDESSLASTKQMNEFLHRLKAISHEYAKQPEGTLVVSPDNQSRMEINRMIHTEMQKTGQVDYRERNVRVLVARQEITGADRQWAEQYEPGNIVRYTRGSKTHAIGAGEYARVERVNARENVLTVGKQNGEQVSYDPRRLQGVTLYRETERAFSQGDRIQFTAPNGGQNTSNRGLGTIEKIEVTGNLQLRLD